MISEKFEIKYIVIQVVLSLVIAFIPIYFYLEATISNEDIKTKQDLKNYANKIANKIDSFAFENSDIFVYPRSNIFNSAIFDNSNQEIFSTKKDIEFFTNSFIEENSQLCYKEFLQENIFEAKSLIICKDIDNSQVIYNVLILLLTLSFFIFILSFFVIKQSIEPYRRVNEYLDNFLKDAMHELKTPIGVARINIDMLGLKHKNDKNILRVKSALKNMTVIYEDLEYYMQQNEVKNEKRELNFSRFLETRVDFFKDLANSKNIEIFKNIEEGIVFEFNEIEAFRIVDNNLSNAIKYSNKDSKIYVELEKTKSGFILEFKDEGVGIEDTSKLFDRYYRGDKITGGFGIGLNIVKNICEKNGIKIEIESKIGENSGTVFKYKFTI